MLNNTLRSVSRPVRSHVCVSCNLSSTRLVNGSSRFYTTAIKENDKDRPSQADSMGDSIRLLDEVLTKKKNFTPVADKISTPEDRHDGLPATGDNEQSGENIENHLVKRKSSKTPPIVLKKLEATIYKKLVVRKSAKPKIIKRRLSDRPPLPIRRLTPKKAPLANSGVKILPVATVIENSPNTVETPIPTEDPIQIVPEPLNVHTGTLNAEDLEFKALDVDTPPVPNLAFGLDRVLFNPGVYQLRDPRSRVYNFDPYLGNIMPVTEFDFDTLKEYKTSSKDETLIQLGREQKKKYVGSSSSMTAVLSHFHYLLSQWRPVDKSTVSQGFREVLQTFTQLTRGPAAVFLHHKDGVYAIDADKEFDNANILMNLGKSMEKLLTLPKEEFERYRRSHANKITPEEENALPESHHYSIQDDFLMRSQLDAHDPRLPGTGMFDLKTRAVVSIRMNVSDYQNGLGYEIHNRFGNFESYEREYYDMIRAAFLKYSLQVRIGRMDGIFVAFHNTERIFGFQYIPISEMDLALHGTTDPALGDREFQLSLKLWNEILAKATAKFPGRSLRLHFETEDGKLDDAKMSIFVQPVTDEQIKAIQERNKSEIDEIQRQLLYPETVDQNDVDVTAAEATNDTAAAVEELKVEATAETKNTDISGGVDSFIDAAIDSSLANAGVRSEEILDDYSDTAAAIPSSTRKEEKVTEEEKQKQKQRDAIPDELFAMELSITNLIDGNPVVRPGNMKPGQQWEVKYELTELPDAGPPSVLQRYQKMSRRRKSALEFKKDEGKSFYGQILSKLAREGKKFREEQNKLDEEHGVVVYTERKGGSAE